MAGERTRGTTARTTPSWRLLALNSTSTMRQPPLPVQALPQRQNERCAIDLARARFASPVGRVDLGTPEPKAFNLVPAGCFLVRQSAIVGPQQTR